MEKDTKEISLEESIGTAVIKSFADKMMDMASEEEYMEYPFDVFWDLLTDWSYREEEAFLLFDLSEFMSKEDYNKLAQEIYKMYMDSVKLSCWDYQQA